MTDTKHECVLLNFTPTESAIYDDLKLYHQKKTHFLSRTAKEQEDPLRELCCKLDPTWGNDLTGIRSYFMKKKTRDVDDAKMAIVTLSRTLADSKALLASKTAGGWQVYEARKFATDFPAKMDNAQHKLDTHKKIKNILDDNVRKKLMRKLLRYLICKEKRFLTEYLLGTTD